MRSGAPLLGLAKYIYYPCKVFIFWLNTEIERLGMLTSMAKFAVVGNNWCTCKICMGYVIA